MIQPCELVLKDCLPCNDDPIVNITAEAPDADIFIGFRNFRGVPPLGVIFTQLACKAICFSTESQRDADLCAQRAAQSCVWTGWRNPVTPPIPPGPDGNTHGFSTPGGIPPPPGPRVRNPVRVFNNTVQTCVSDCPDGTPFIETVPAGTVRALSQAGADALAKALACQLADQDKICFITDTLASTCVNQSYSTQIVVEGGTPFADQPYAFDVASGDLPPGLSIDGETGIISGTPFVNGNFTFTIGVVDAADHQQFKEFSICVMEIVTASVLPQADQNQDYAQPLVQEPGTVASEAWTLVGGSLPPGITLASNGALSGKATDLGTFNFTLQVAATCGDGPATCQKSFSLEVVSGVCMGNPSAFEDLTWTPDGTNNIAFPMAGASGSFNGSSAVTNCRGKVSSTICNPNPGPYTLTITYDWTVGGFVAFIQTDTVIAIDGVETVVGQHFANGTYHDTVMIPLTPGVHTVYLRVDYGGAFGTGTINGTVTISPPTPP